MIAGGRSNSAAAVLGPPIELGRHILNVATIILAQPTAAAMIPRSLFVRSRLFENLSRPRPIPPENASQAALRLASAFSDTERTLSASTDFNIERSR
jgi:hypothetical protein